MAVFAKASTPPLSPLGFAAMTPPDTGTKRARSSTPQFSRKRLQVAANDVDSFAHRDFEVESSFDEGEGLSEGSSCSPVEVSSPVTPKIPACKISDFVLDCHVDPQDSVVASSTEKPFNFMGLPLAIRQRIYSMALVIPAIICVRQKRTAYSDQKQAYLYAEPRLLLPGIAYALAQLTVDGTKFRFSRFRYTNVSLLRVSRQVHSEAKPIMYSENAFEILAPSPEMTPTPDYKIPLFPRGYQKHIQQLVIRVRAGYPLRWLLDGGYAELKKAYAGLETLTVILEMESMEKSLGKRWAKQNGKHWTTYVKLLHEDLRVEFFGRDSVQKKTAKHVPLWMDLRVLFDGERYDSIAEVNDDGRVSGCVSKPAADTDHEKEEASRLALKRAIPQAFELFKKGGI